MKLPPTLFSRNTILLSLAAGLTGSAYAGFQYNPQDLLIGLRRGSIDSELVVNAGSVSNYLAVPLGSTITVSNVASGQLTAAFANLNNLYFSAAAVVRTSGNPAYPLQTIWVTSPRSAGGNNAPNTPTPPWLRDSQFGQGVTGGKVEGIGNNAVSYANGQPTGANNSSTGVLIPSGNTFAYSTLMGTAGNYQGAFQGNVEVKTTATFTTDGLPARADFYQLIPGGGSGTYLGFFEFRTNGVMTYTAGPAPVLVPPRPTITSIDRSDTTTTVSFTTSPGAQYSLIYAGNAGLSTPQSAWPVVAGSQMAGDGTEQSATDDTTDDQRFYSISATIP